MTKSEAEYDLFNDTLDTEVRNHNRATFLANIFEDHTPTGSSFVDQFGAARIIKYFSLIPKEDQKDVLSKYNHIMESRGYKEVK